MGGGEKTPERKGSAGAVPTSQIKIAIAAVERRDWRKNSSGKRSPCRDRNGCVQTERIDPKASAGKGEHHKKKIKRQRVTRKKA